MGREARSLLAEIEARLRPRLMRSWALSHLDDLFVQGAPPDPAPGGFCRGRALAVSFSEVLDAASRRLAELYMPWLGKSFDPGSSGGVNILTPSARGPMRLLWPSYVPERELADRIEAFPFETRLGPGEVDPSVRVLKIDYDFDPNPRLIVRRVLDEIVEIDSGLYLGKVLYRSGASYRALGFFCLEGRTDGGPT